MKKQLFLSLTMAIAACTMQAQVLNSSFENLNGDATIKNWGAVIITQITVGIDSTGADTTNGLIVDGQFYASNTDAHTGSYALQMRNGYYVATGEQIAGRAKMIENDSVYDTFSSPLTSGGQPVAFNFYYKYFPAGNDTAFARLQVFNGANYPIGEAAIYISGTTSSYTLASVPVTYTSSDTAVFMDIQFVTAKPGTAANFGTSFLVDDVQLVNTATGIASIKAANTSISCFPNPAEQQLNLRLNNAAGTKATGLYITDVCGKQIENINYSIAGNTITADVASLLPGMYIATVLTDKGSCTARFVK
ncbi:MAG: C-terminal target protein [Bacteroidetes bacterium]|nr:C-terminal target protein [Bacteroidota bacterium]